MRGGAGFYNGSSCELLRHLIEPTGCKIGFATGGQTLAFVLVVFRSKKKNDWKETLDIPIVYGHWNHLSIGTVYHFTGPELLPVNLSQGRFFSRTLEIFFFLLGSTEDLRKGREVVLLALFLSFTSIFNKEKKIPCVWTKILLVCIIHHLPSRYRLGSPSKTAHVEFSHAEVRKKGGKWKQLQKIIQRYRPLVMC